jgi:hypothetical protein
LKTWTGNWAPLTHPDGKVSLLDVVMTLGRENRWGNFGSTEYKVLHHSMLVALIWMRAGFAPSKVVYPLMHDAHETYSKDLPTPLKRLLGVEQVERLQALFDKIMRQFFRYRLPSKRTQERVRLCDAAALIIEAPFFGPPGSYEKLRPEATPAVMNIVNKVFPDFEEVIERRRTYAGR